MPADYGFHYALDCVSRSNRISYCPNEIYPSTLSVSSCRSIKHWAGVDNPLQQPCQPNPTDNLRHSDQRINAHRLITGLPINSPTPLSTSPLLLLTLSPYPDTTNLHLTIGVCPIG